MMTTDDVNAKLQDLRKRLAWLRTEQLAVEQMIRDINMEYKRPYCHVSLKNGPNTLHH